MNIATINDLAEIKEIFSPHLKTYFPHIRMDYLKREIEKGNVILVNDVVIVYNLYKRKQKIGNVEAQAGDASIKQIVTKTQGKGSASSVLQSFFKHINTNVWLTVREENQRARSFYLKNGMKEVGVISWSSGTLPGVVYLYKK